ncbi:hypothetical protein TNIN_377611 [Trichonephila inaurata madagascariensis]|uniref:Uncharacterized protein n=1 Tax=Trichonephila inaurata madagascariensis TaxID=2747483 RepID=A0A8X7CMD7_9ARAC|nr:hypothetical protein TNIN_377611 [Trichonephila inaurata madagascariensis]
MREIFLKQRGFLDLPITSNGKECVPLAFAQTMSVTRSLLTLKPGAGDPRFEADDFLSRAFQFTPVSSTL